MAREFFRYETPYGRPRQRTNYFAWTLAILLLTAFAFAAWDRYQDCELGLKRWNRQLERAGIGLQLSLPSPRFRRAIGVWSGVHCDPSGKVIDAGEYQRREGEWLPTEADRAFVKSLMQRVIAPGKMAGWIAAPERGINSLPIEYEYVRL